MVAHRLSTIKDADQIMVLRNGETVESGTHRDLISKNGVYAEMTRIQSFNNKSGIFLNLARKRLNNTTRQDVLNYMVINLFSDDDSIEEENKLKGKISLNKF